MLKGEKETVAVCWPGLPEDEVLDMIRMDGLIRSNASVKLGEAIEVSPINVAEATRVVLAPSQPVRFQKGFEQYVKQQIINKPITRGDILVVASIGQGLQFVPSLSAISRPIPKIAPMETKNGIRNGKITIMPNPKIIIAAPLVVSMSGAS